MIEVGKKYNERNLRYMTQFYEVFSSVKWNPLGSKLSWSHFRKLLIVKNTDAIMNYVDQNIKTIEENATVRLIIVCKQDNEYVIKYCSDERIIARRYIAK